MFRFKKNCKIRKGFGAICAYCRERVRYKIETETVTREYWFPSCLKRPPSIKQKFAKCGKCNMPIYVNSVELYNIRKFEQAYRSAKKEAMNGSK